jgi:hypothetical protein
MTNLVFLALLTPARAAPDCSLLDPATAEACYCVFHSVPADWTQTPRTWDETGTCFEFTRVVNLVPKENRTDALGRMDTVAQVMACASHRRFTRWKTNLPGGWVWVTDQLLETMAEDECNIEDDLALMREAWVLDVWAGGGM